MRKQMTDDGEKKSNGRGDPAPTLTMRVYKAFETIRRLFVFVKVGARFPRPLDNEGIQGIRDYSPPVYFCQGRGAVPAPASCLHILFSDSLPGH
jgi:hypothetical protein